MGLTMMVLMVRLLAIHCRECPVVVENRSSSQTAWVQLLTPPFPNSLLLGKLCNFSVPQCLYLLNGVNKIPTSLDYFEA